MATVKWELEDLSFAILHPKKYEEIVRLVADRAPSRDTYLAKVRAEIGAALGAMKIGATVEGRPKHYWSIYQKMIVKGRDFDDIHDLVGRADPVRRDPRLLRRRRGRALAVAAHRGTVQGLHRTAPLRGVPVAAHHRRRPRGQAAGSADPHHRHAQDGRIRHRRALDVQGSQGAQRSSGRSCRGGDRRDGVDAPTSRLAAGGRRSRRVPRVAALRPRRSGDLRLHAEGRRRHAAHRIVSRGLRLRRAHRGRAPLHRCSGQRTPGGARAQTRKRRSGRGFHLQGAECRSVARLADLRRVTAGEGQDPPVVRQGTARGGARVRQGRDRS